MEKEQTDNHMEQIPRNEFSERYERKGDEAMRNGEYYLAQIHYESALRNYNDPLCWGWNSDFWRERVIPNTFWGRLRWRHMLGGYWSKLEKKTVLNARKRAEEKLRRVQRILSDREMADLNARIARENARDARLRLEEERQRRKEQHDDILWLYFVLKHFFK